MVTFLETTRPAIFAFVRLVVATTVQFYVSKIRTLKYDAQIFRLHQDDNINACEKKVSQNEVANKTMGNNRIFKEQIFFIQIFKT